VRPTTRPEVHALEFHDSRIEAISKHGNNLELALDGYLHCKEGDRTTGWSQTVIMKLANGSVVAAPTEFPTWISDGDLSIAGAVMQDLLDLPYQTDQDVRFFGVTDRGEKFEFTGHSLSVSARGEAKYIEEVRL